MTRRAMSSAIFSLDCEHRVIERVLGALDRFAVDPILVPVPVWARAMDFLSNFADGLHHAKEEEVLFPALAERGLPAQQGPVACMLRDHDAGRELRQSMASALPMLGSDPAAARTLTDRTREYVLLMRFHIQKEDTVLFPLADSLFDDPARQRISRRFGEVIEARVNGDDVSRYLAVADELAAVAEAHGPAPAEIAPRAPVVVRMPR